MVPYNGRGTSWSTKNYGERKKKQYETKEASQTNKRKLLVMEPVWLPNYNSRIAAVILKK